MIRIDVRGAVSEYDAPRENFAGGLVGVDIPQLGIPSRGKVRDNWITSGENPIRVMVTTDRQSAYDRIIGTIPGKGQVLNLLSAWWFENTRDIIPNHVIAVPHPNVLIARQVKDTLPVEIVLRRYMARSSTSTSVYDHYVNKGERVIYGINFPDGLEANGELPETILTPTTKAEGGKHDKELTDDEARETVDGKLGVGKWEEVKRAAHALFERGRTRSLESGLILVDTKYEFGIDGDGNLMLIDEIHTPDSSRFWKADTYLEKFARGETPDTFDKEILRRWLSEHGFKGDGPVPKVDREIMEQMARAYAVPYEMITGEKLPVPALDPSEVTKSVLHYLVEQDPKLLSPEIIVPKQRVVIVMGSEKDKDHVDKIKEVIDKFGISVDIRIRSAHKTPAELLRLIKDYEDKEEELVYIAVAGRSNALGGFIDANTRYPVINAPPPADFHTIYSSLDMPSGVGAVTVIYPEAAALHAIKIMAQSNPELARKYLDFQESNRQKIDDADKKLQN